MYLLDTNIWLERLLDQDRADEVRQLLDKVPSDQLLISDFSFHSVGVILHRLKRQAALLAFVEDLFVEGAVGIVSLHPTDMERLVEVARDFRLDFDDAYQYVLVEGYDVPLVSFDHDFDRTERGRVTPLEVVATLDAKDAEEEEEA
jgi:predicted nucleic acid-binding protein